MRLSANRYFTLAQMLLAALDRSLARGYLATMAATTAVNCARSGCSNRSRHVSGRCPHHRVDAAVAAAGAAAPAPPPAPTESGDLAAGLWLPASMTSERQREKVAEPPPAGPVPAAPPAAAAPPKAAAVFPQRVRSRPRRRWGAWALDWGAAKQIGMMGTGGIWSGFGAYSRHYFRSLGR